MIGKIEVRETDGQRRLMQDDSCHWYAIPVGKEQQFRDWVRYMGGTNDDYEGPDFDDDRLNFHIQSYAFDGFLLRPEKREI